MFYSNDSCNNPSCMDNTITRDLDYSSVSLVADQFHNDNGSVMRS